MLGVSLREEVSFRVSFSRRGVFFCFFRHGRRMEKDNKCKEVRVGCFFAYRGTSLIIKKRPSLGPYRSPMPRVLGGWAFSYERGTPVHKETANTHLLALPVLLHESPMAKETQKRTSS